MPKRFLIFIVLLLACRAFGDSLLLDADSFCLGARSLGMGRAYITLTSEADAPFLNPAALAEVQKTAYTGMYSLVQNKVFCLTAGSNWTAAGGTFGLSYFYTFLPGPPNVVFDPSGLLLLQNGGTPINFRADTLALSYGTKLAPNLLIGAKAKLFMQEITDPSASGKGMDADLGLLYHYDQNLTFGIMQRNLFASVGAKIYWNNNYQEIIPNATRMGVSYLYQNFLFTGDYEFYPSSFRKSIFMFGGEWQYMPELSFRIGLDQLDPTTNNFTFGASCQLGQMRLDYTFHQYTPDSLNTSFLSFSFFPEMPASPASKESAPINYLSINAPSDQLITAETLCQFEGAASPEVKRLEINDRPVAVANGTFNITQPLKLGKNGFVFIAYGSKEEKLALQKIRVLNLPSFEDVPSGYWAAYPIALMDQLNLVNARRGGTFEPEGTIPRAEMLKILLNLTAVGQGKFSPIAPDQPLSQPGEIINRAEAVVMLVKLTNLPVVRIKESPFPDIAGRYWASEEIAAAKKAGWLQYLAGRAFNPDKNITRAELCQILSKIDAVQLAIARQLDFNQGY